MKSAAISEEKPSLMMLMGESPPRERGRRGAKLESDMIRRRERDFKHQQMWSGAQDYYRQWDKVNSKFEQWTSPRYYEDNNKMLSELRHKQNKEELLLKRREALRHLLEQEDSSFQIELTVKRSLDVQKPKDVSTETLRDVNSEVKQRNEEKRKREAEIKLYHQWRSNNPIIRQFESKYKFKDLKLSWLDQQIEKRMQKEAEEKECRRVIKEQEERRKRVIEEEALMNKQSEEKKMKLRECLDKQVEELKEKQKISDQLRSKECEELKRKKQLEDLQEATKLEQKRRMACETALFNIKQHKLKLKKKAQDVLEALAQDQQLILHMKKLELEELMEDEKKKQEIKLGLDEFLSVVKQQQELERQRQKHFDFLFDSEAKAFHDKQMGKWQTEELARKNLLKSVLDEISKQVEEKMQNTKKCQKEVLREREEMMLKVEQYDRDMQALKEQDEKRKHEIKREFEDDIKLKNAKKKQEENAKMKQIDVELRHVRQEEERLREEIMKMQNRSNVTRNRGGGRFY